MAKKNIISKLYLKYSDKKAYKLYKQELVNLKHARFEAELKSSTSLIGPQKIKAFALVNKCIDFNHSGNAGDIIYALATLKRIHQIAGIPLNLYLKLNRPSTISPDLVHPLGNVMLNARMVQMLIPLIQSQPYINICDVNNNVKVDIDLDFFRASIIPQDRGNIAHWCGYTTGITPRLWQSWLTVDANKNYGDDIVVARSERYRNSMIDYSFLSRYDKIKFIGVESEFKDIQKAIPHIQWVQVNDFLQMAQIIAGCKFFIGNQSFPYSLAEALKVKRILEVCVEVINVVPEGDVGYDFIFQEHFEALVQELDAGS
ncbi:hypothetical protein [Mucilaginibacter psychrotolerans]|uniref:Glycosyl transferase n=1 Tax=Mucilaginibacter psychrotolerans TaxID=1524096 RepID=A0A4Y8S4W9_9SPHI|nr:hypothetical protein [Mucilaginibacter psychrotolerans]TFF33701.1 hypothetical protein E2R66_24835 [Mucilaginibacter psychrotolerans]